MRPNLTEQLNGVCRILEESIAPELGESHTGETLRNLVANVRMLARAWPRLLPFLLWDNAHTTTLLTAARAGVDDALRARIDGTFVAAPTEATDWEAVERHNDALRECLSACIVAGLAPAVDARVRAHLRERAKRYPLRVTGAQPKARKAAE